MNLDCLNDIIGLSASSCNCWDSTKPVDFNDLNTSTSGLYIAQSDTIPLRWTNSAADCENGGIWQLLVHSLYGADNNGGAIRDILKDYLTLTQRSKVERFEPFNLIGDKYYKLSEAVKSNYAAVYLEPYEIKGGKLNIESIEIAFHSGITAPVSIDITLYSSLDLNTPIATATANVTGNKEFFKATFASIVTIDFGKIRTDKNERLFFAYEIPVGAKPVRNDTYIQPCCSKSIYDRNPYLNIMCLGGVQSDSIANLDRPIISAGRMQGLVLNASFECDYYSWLCQLSQQPNQIYSINNGQRLRLGMGLADTIQAKALINLIESLLNSSRINDFTLLQDDKQIYRKLNHYKKVYENGLKNLVYYMPSDVSDCLQCADNEIIVRGEILV